VTVVCVPVSSNVEPLTWWAVSISVIVAPGTGFCSVSVPEAVPPFTQLTVTPVILGVVDWVAKAELDSPIAPTRASVNAIMIARTPCLDLFNPLSFRW
jgi:hypothetical protein